MPVKLEPEARRKDLTIREMTSIIGGLVGGLCENSDPKKVRLAFKWWAETDAAWFVFHDIANKKLKKVAESLITQHLQSHDEHCNCEACRTKRGGEPI